MTRERLLIALLCVVALVSTCSAATVPRGLSGTWWDPQLSGQGVVLEEYSGASATAPNLVTLAWFTYDELGNPVYLVGSGEYKNGEIEMNVTTTRGGRHGQDMRPGTVSSTPWGVVTVTPESCSTILVEYQRAGAAQSGVVKFTRFNAALGRTTINQACSMVEVAADTNVPAKTVRFERCDGFFGCSASSLPFTSSASQSTSVLGARLAAYTVTTFKLTAVDGYVDVAYIGVEDSHATTLAFVQGLTQGQRVTAGQSVTFTLMSAWTSNITETLRYKIGLDYDGFDGSATRLSVDYTSLLRTN